MSDFQKELEGLLNKHSKENASNTPDFILATYLVGCLKAFDEATSRRSQWYGQADPEAPTTQDPNRDRSINDF